MAKCCKRDNNSDDNCDVHKVPSREQVLEKLLELKHELRDDGAYLCDYDFHRFVGAVETLEWVLGKGKAPEAI